MIFLEVPEVLEVQVVPSEEVRIAPEKPTATKVLLPSYATDLRLFDVPEVLEVQVVPSVEVSRFPEAPTAINNPLELELELEVVVEELSVLLLSSFLAQEITVRLKSDIRITCTIFSSRHPLVMKEEGLKSYFSKILQKYYRINPI